ncbi:MAG: hypothetical protein COA83_00385 [Methylophaga sp.]|nr:MAG: hypothetical protein COA83_00385 [Methylophaga sp.]
MVWVIKSWADLLEIRSGRNQKEVLDSNGDYPILGSAGKIMGYANSYLCEEGTTIVGRKGTIDNPLYINTNFWNVDTAFGLIAGDLLNKKYLYYFCKSFNFKNLDKGTTLPSLVKKDLLKILMPVAPIPEQKRIVAILDQAFAEIELARAHAQQNLNNARELFASYLQQVFSQRGDGWPSEKFRKVCKFVRGPFGGALKKNIFKPEGFAVYEQQHAIYDQFTEVRYFIDNKKFSEMSRFELLSGDLIMSCSGTMGKIAIVPDGIKQGIINQALLKLTPEPQINRQFPKIWMQSPNFQTEIESLSQGAAIKNMASVKILKEINLPLPSLDEQEKIVEIYNQIKLQTDNLSIVYENKIKALDELKKSILQKAFTGELTKKSIG